MRTSRSAWTTVLAITALFAVLTLGIAHEYDHDAEHVAESCAICATVRAPRAASPLTATIVFLLLATAFVAPTVGVAARPTTRSARCSRGPPCA